MCFLNLKMSTICLLYNHNRLIIGEENKGGDCSELDKQHCGYSTQTVKVRVRVRVRGSPDMPLGECHREQLLASCLAL